MSSVTITLKELKNINIIDCPKFKLYHVERDTVN